MPNFEFTSPEGKKYTVTGPDGATKEQAFQMLQAQLAGGAPAEAAPGSLVPSPPGAAERLAAAHANQPADPTLVDKIIGGGEAALTTLSGLTTGTMAMLDGTAGGIIQSVRDGTFGTKQGIDNVEKAAGEAMTRNTYVPRTQSGQDQAAAVGNALSATVPVMGLSAEMGALGRGVGGAVRTVRETALNSASALDAADAAAVAGKSGGLRGLVTAPKGAPEAPVVSQIRKVSPAIADRVQRTLTRNPDPTPTPGTLGSVGAAGTDMATQRTQVADKVGVKLTVGQAARDQQQIRFEQETGKGAQGAAFRDRWAEQNEQIGKHFDNLVDMTGAEATDLLGTGRAVDQALTAKFKRDKAQVRVAYKEAEKAGELEQPVALGGLVEHLNESAPDAATAPLLTVARSRAIQLGIAAENADGQLVAVPTTLKNAERMRQAIGRATDAEATNIRQSSIIKGLIDTETDGMGGGLYKAARRTRENFAKQYEDRGVVASLLNNKRGSADRKVALEDVFAHTVLKGSRADLGHVRRVLQTGGEQGQQAWRELQGATVNHIKEQAFANTATDQRGNVILSAAKLDRVLKTLDQDGKLDFVFGKQGAQHMRDLNDLAKVTHTAPPGAVNTSNTASVLLAALTEAGVTGSMTGLPVPVLSTIRLLSIHAKNRKLQARIEHALNNQRSAPPPRPAQPQRTLH